MYKKFQLNFLVPFSELNWQIRIMSKKPMKSMTIKKTAGQRKAAKGYKLPNPIPVGEIVRDVTKKEWQIGPSIGVGGFGEIYSGRFITVHTPSLVAKRSLRCKWECNANTDVTELCLLSEIVFFEQCF
jgi:hypothetical protein